MHHHLHSHYNYLFNILEIVNFCFTSIENLFIKDIQCCLLMGNTLSDLSSPTIATQHSHPSGTIVVINQQQGRPETLTEKTIKMSNSANSNGALNRDASNVDVNMISASRDASMADIPDQSSLQYNSRNCSEQYIENADYQEQASSNSSSFSSLNERSQQERDGSMMFDSDNNSNKPDVSHNEKLEDSDDSLMVDEQKDEGNNRKAGGDTMEGVQNPVQPIEKLQPESQITSDRSQNSAINSQQQQQQQQQQRQQQQQQQQQPYQPVQPILVPTIFKWTEGGRKVFVMGTFTGWRKMIALNGPSPKDGSFSVQIALPPGMHRFKFVVDNEVRCSNFIPTATDNSGHFVNYLEIIPSERELCPERNDSRVSLRSNGSKLGLTKDDDDMGNGYTRYHQDQIMQLRKVAYTNEIPPIFTDPKVMEEYYVTLDNSQKNGGHNQQWLIPPQLPPHLENVTLNGYNSNDKSNTSGALSIPNHVVLNHLATTSIKHNTLAVASVVRYKRKYVTQILYAPLQ